MDGSQPNPLRGLCLWGHLGLCWPSLSCSSGVKLSEVLKFHQEETSQWARPPFSVLPGGPGTEAALKTTVFESLASGMRSQPFLSRFCCSTPLHQLQSTQKFHRGRPNFLSASPKTPPWVVHVGQRLLLHLLSRAGQSHFGHLSAQISGFWHTLQNSRRPGCAGHRAGELEFHTRRGRSQPGGGLRES